MPLYADPFLTANIYWAGHLDAAAFKIVRPAWQEFQKSTPDHGCYLWMMRYGRGGEHLKVRVHGAEHHKPHLSRLLEKMATPCLSAPPLSFETVQKRGWIGAPPIDAEDDTEVDHPDRTLLWTQYRRSHVSLGGEPFLSQDLYAAHVTASLACGSEMVLALEPTDAGILSHKVRQSTLLKGLIGGLAACNFSSKERIQYLVYHRNWLLRFVLPKERRMDTEPVQQIIGRFDTRLLSMEEVVRTLREAAAHEWAHSPTEPARPESPWRRSLTSLIQYAAPFCTEPSYRLDPFADNPVFAPVFKVFHGLGNQLGLNLADEAFAHHILLQAALVAENSLVTS